MGIRISPDELIVCRNLAENKTFNEICSAIAEEDHPISLAVTGLISSAEHFGHTGNILRAFIVENIANEKSIVTQMMEASGGQIGDSLREAFIHDLSLLLPLLLQKPTELLPQVPSFIDDYLPTMERELTDTTATLSSLIKNASTAEDFANGFLTYYLTYGCGDMANYRAFAWDSKKQCLTGIRHFEPILLSHLIGYQQQKDALTKNTLAFLSDRPANNALLVGDRGTGKSTSIKALANEYFRIGLRLVQVTKQQLKELPQIMEVLREYASKHFIIFLDDLSFEADESDYKHIKSAIEGGVEPRPENVLIYATSNRRHLIRETWQGHDEPSDEDLYNNDTVNETVSLSDRFGLIIKYRAPNQEEYLAIIDHALRTEGVILPPEELRLEGKRWELEHSGRNGRTAKQFAAYYLGQKVNH